MATLISNIYHLLATEDYLEPEQELSLVRGDVLKFMQGNDVTFPPQLSLTTYTYNNSLLNVVINEIN